MSDSDLFPWGDGRRYHSYNAFMKARYGGRVQKLPVNAGFTCPNRDGTRGVGGCSYCLNKAFNPSYCTPTKSISEQLREGMSFHLHHNRNIKGYIAYFQAFSNTYAPVEHLRALHEEALNVPNIVGITIATRPDCLGDDVLDYLEELSGKTRLCVEVGVESCRDETLRRIHRGHDFACSQHALWQLHARNIECGAHLIFGLPGESPDQWLEDVRKVNALPMQHIKFHQLQIIKGTAMEQEYLSHPEDFHHFTFEGYVTFLAEHLSHLNPAFAVERLASAVPPRYTATPGWHGIKYDAVVRAVEKHLAESDSHQGKLFSI
jgi:radical SAM protein, TIGR01212 family